MREVGVTVAMGAAESVIDRLIGIAPYGIRDDVSGENVVLRIRAPDDELAPVAEFARRAGAAVLSIDERDVPDDWHARRLLDYKPQVIGDICVRPSWAPLSDVRIDVVIEETDAFGSGVHPTTRDCIALLAAVGQRGAFADLGCGSGVLSIVAAKLGFTPVTAVDVRDAAVTATRRNAVCNAVEVDASVIDLLTEPTPFAPVICANAPPAVHDAAARSIAGSPDIVIVSGILAHEFEEVVQTYARLGLAPEQLHEEARWITCMFTR
jgi:ribosomal protein L11 methyltransferase